MNSLNDARMTFDPATHTYWWRGRSYPSVTQILQRAGTYDHLKNIPRHILEKARRRGEEVHAQIHLYHLLQAPFKPSSKPVEGCLLAYERFLTDSRYNLVETEISGINPGKGYGGTLDSMGYLNGELSLVDIKATAQIDKPSVEMQTAAYAPIWNEGILSIPKLNSMIRGEIQKRFVLHLKKNGRYSLVECDDPAAYHKFLSYM